MSTDFQKIISITLLVAGLVASLWHIRLLRMATDTASLNQKADDFRQKDTSSTLKQRDLQDSDKRIESNKTVFEANTVKAFSSNTTTTTSAPDQTSSEHYPQQTSSVTEDVTETSTLETTSNPNHTNHSLFLQ